MINFVRSGRAPKIDGLRKFATKSARRNKESSSMCFWDTWMVLCLLRLSFRHGRKVGSLNRRIGSARKRQRTAATKTNTRPKKALRRARSCGRSNNGGLFTQFFRGKLHLGAPDFPINPEAVTESLRFFGKDSCADRLGLCPQLGAPPIDQTKQ